MKGELCSRMRIERCIALKNIRPKKCKDGSKWTKRQKEMSRMQENGLSIFLHPGDDVTSKFESRKSNCSKISTCLKNQKSPRKWNYYVTCKDDPEQEVTRSDQNGSIIFRKGTDLKRHFERKCLNLERVVESF